MADTQEKPELHKKSSSKKKSEFKDVTRDLAKEMRKGHDLELTVVAINDHNAANDIENQHNTMKVEKPKEDVVLDGLTNEQSLSLATLVMFFFEVAIIFLYGFCARVVSIEHFTDYYQMYVGICIMMFFGFGYLMTFLKRYGMGAVGFTCMITVLGVQWGILTESFFKMSYSGDWGFIEVDILHVIDGMFLVAAILISYGGVIGKVSPLQLVIMTFLEAIFYSINKAVLLLGVVDLVDAGGTINIHMFGAFFGLAVAYVLGKPKHTTDFEGGHVADLFSLIGTTFLWIYWPSFNGGALEPNSDQHQRALINTILSLCASTVGAFFTSSYLSSSWKFRPVDIQNATLAGGVAIGAVCHFTLRPSDSLLIGLSAGFASTFGFARVQHVLEGWGVHDTCGIHNLHGIPSLIGGIASIILAGYKGPMRHDMPDPILHENQWEDQFISVAFTLSVAIASGILTGFVLYFIRTDENSIEFFSDTPYWEVMDDFGRSFESETDKINKGLKDLEVGIRASQMLSRIIQRYSEAGLNDLTSHSQVSTQSEETQKRNAAAAASASAAMNEVHDD